MRFKSIFPRLLQFLVLLSLAITPVTLNADLFSDIKNKLQEELKRGSEKLNEKLQRTIDQVNNPSIEVLTQVPSLLGKTPVEAENTLSEHRLVLGKVTSVPSQQTAGTIISQSHGINSTVKQGTVISVEVAMQQQTTDLVIVPNLFGLRIDEAKQQLQHRSLRLGKVERKESKYPEETIIWQKPKNGNKVQRKSAINIILAKPIQNTNKTQVTLILSKDVIHVGETVTMQAKINPKPKASLQYSFSLGGKVHSSQDGFLTHTFQKEGRVIITASVRRKHKKWLHSAPSWLVIKKNNGHANTDDVGAVNISVPDVVGLSLDDARRKIEGSNLKIGTIQQRNSSGKSRILEQTPQAGEKVSTGTQINLLQSIPYNFSFSLSANKTEIQQYESVEFQGLLETNQQNNLSAVVRYHLIVDEKDIVSDQAFWLYKFDEAGTHRIVAEAHIDGVGTYKSNVLTIKASNTWVEPRAIIEPSTLVVEQGQSATFTSQSIHDKSSKLKLFWMDESGGNDNGKKYTIDTTDWEIGDYWVSLRVKDSRGIENTDKAEIIVTKQGGISEDPSPAEDKPTESQIEPADIKLALSASAYHIIAGKPVKFTVSQQPITNTEYHIIFGDDNDQTTLQPWSDHQYNKLGQYSAYVETQYKEKTIASEKIKIWVWPSWFLIGFTGFAILLLASIFKLLSPKIHKEIKAKTSHVRYVPIVDEGEQKIELNHKASQDKETHFAFVAEVDEGKQWMTYKNEQDE